MGQGHLGHIGIGKETTWGTPVAATDYIEALNESINAEIDRFDTVNIRSQHAEPSDEAGIKRIGGDLEIAGNPLACGFLLKGALQSHSQTTVLSGFLYTNTFMSLVAGEEFHADCPLQPYTVEVFRDVTTSVQYTGCVVDALSIEFSPNQDVRFAASLIGRNEASIAATTPTFVTSPGRPFKFNTASVQIGGAANADLEALTIDISNSLEGVATLDNSDIISRIRQGNFQMVNVSGTFDFDDLDEYDNFIAQTEQSLVVSVTQADSFAMTVDIPKMVYTAFPLNTPGRQRLSVDFEGKAFYHAGSDTAIQIDLTTVKSDY